MAHRIQIKPKTVELRPGKPHLIQWFYSTESATGNFIGYHKLNYAEIEEARKQTKITFYGPYSTFRLAKVAANYVLRQKLDKAKDNYRRATTAREPEAMGVPRDHNPKVPV